MSTASRAGVAAPSLVSAAVRPARGACGLVAVLVLAACASTPPPPAPVEQRTRPPAAAAPRPAPPPVRPAPAVSPPVAPPVAPPAAAAPGAGRARDPAVQTTPVRPGSVEPRPLPPAPAAAAPSPSNLLREPRATKRPFSEAALAEMRAADAAVVGAAVGATEAAAAPGSAPPPPAVSAAPPAPAPADGEAASRAAEFAWPLRGRLLQGFGEGRSTGLSIAATPGDPVLAAGDGRVIFSGPGPRGYGNLIILKHEGDLLSVYGHSRALLVKEGQSVRRGQPIAEAGDSGTDRPKLLFEIRRGGKPVDPAGLLPAL
jgi:lipoprotein NlpD